MSDVIIENPVINSPYKEPTRHFKFTDEGISNEIEESRRVSSYFMPIPRVRKQKDQLEFDTEWTQDRIEENKEINRIRERVSQWRKGGYIGITRTSTALLEYWTSPERENKLFFCQIEALETAIYLTEVANRYGDNWIENKLKDYNDGANPGLYRIAFKMATGSGKTVVMAMLIAWQALNKIANLQDNRFTDTFLIVTPGITIRDRLRVLLPNDPSNYYKLRDLLPPEYIEQIQRAKILIINYHAFLHREKISAGKITKSILAPGETNPFTETPDEMVRRVCRELGNKKNIIVINDEAHHCYQRKPDAEEEKLKGEERKEVQKREEEARVWISGLRAVQNKLGIKVIYDLSATPFFLRGSGYPEGKLFPWVVSDFSLIDSIESGIVKVPRVPVSDNSMVGEQPTYRDLWYRIREHLPKKGRNKGAVNGEPHPPVELDGALHSLYTNYEKYYKSWKESQKNGSNSSTPPVFIVVCNNTSVSKLVFDYISGWEKELEDGKKVLVPGNLAIFSNVDHGNWIPRPNTILIDSEQLESGEAMSDEFKKIASREIEEFKDEYRLRFPGRDIDKLTDEDLLREVMNTVGKQGKLGEQVKCVVSVSMLTEGWDANTVTHILGVRAFGTQLLCEQVVGRGLRRMNYAPNPDGMFEPEYAEVYGVPFSFIPCSGSNSQPQVSQKTTWVRALEERINLEITFPRVTGYRYQIDSEKLQYQFDNRSIYQLTTLDIPTLTESHPIVGEGSIHKLDDLKEHREQEVAFFLAKNVLAKYFTSVEPDSSEAAPNYKPFLFPQVYEITKKWMQECLTLGDNTFTQLLLLYELADVAATKIWNSILKAEKGKKVLMPVLEPYDTMGYTRFVNFHTARPVYTTKADKCHISHVVCDTESWEQKMAQVIESMEETLSYVKNTQHLGFYIPYSKAGESHRYLPDFIVRLKNPQGDITNLIVEVTGESKKDKENKAETANNLWIPAINNHGGFGHWAYIEIRNPWNVEKEIRGIL